MHRLSVVQAVALWSLLDDAYYGQSHFGGDVAEIYVYTLMAHSPLASECAALGPPIPYLRSLAEQDIREANETFLHLLAHFSIERDANIEVERWNGESWQFSEIGPWVATLGQSHRFHVRVRPREGRRERPSGP